MFPNLGSDSASVRRHGWSLRRWCYFGVGFPNESWTATGFQSTIDCIKSCLTANTFWCVEAEIDPENGSFHENIQSTETLWLSQPWHEISNMSQGSPQLQCTFCKGLLMQTANKMHTIQEEHIFCHYVHVYNHATRSFTRDVFECQGLLLKLCKSQDLITMKCDLGAVCACVILSKRKLAIASFQTNCPMAIAHQALLCLQQMFTRHKAQPDSSTYIAKFRLQAYVHLLHDDVCMFNTKCVCFPHGGSQPPCFQPGHQKVGVAQIHE